MCLGHVSCRKLKVMKEDVPLKNDSSIRTLGTESSISFISEDPLVKSCLKVKTQEESLKKKISSSPEDDRGVYFSTLEIRTFPLRLGDNPSAAGPPLTIAWDPEHTTSHDVDDYEEARGERRSLEQLKVSRLVRQEWLRDEGYARGEVMQAQAAAMRIQRGRMASAKESVGFSESKELVKRKFKKWVLHAPSNKELYVKWKQELSQPVTAMNQVISCST